jgi:hypothetical protein
VVIVTGLTRPVLETVIVECSEGEEAVQVAVAAKPETEKTWSEPYFPADRPVAVAWAAIGIDAKPVPIKTRQSKAAR